MKTISKTRFHFWWIGVILGALAASVLFSGCGPALRARARVDATGYEIGITGTWRAVAEQAAKVLQPTPVVDPDGKTLAR